MAALSLRAAVIPRKDSFHESSILTSTHAPDTLMTRRTPPLCIYVIHAIIRILIESPFSGAKACLSPSRYDFDLPLIMTGCHGLVLWPVYMFGVLSPLPCHSMNGLGSGWMSEGHCCPWGNRVRALGIFRACKALERKHTVSRHTPLPFEVPIIRKADPIQSLECRLKRCE